MIAARCPTSPIETTSPTACGAYAYTLTRGRPSRDPPGAVGAGEMAGFTEVGVASNSSSTSRMRTAPCADVRIIWTDGAVRRRWKTCSAQAARRTAASLPPASPWAHFRLSPGALDQHNPGQHS